MEPLKVIPLHQQVINSVCHYYGITKEELFGKCRQELYATARHTCFYFLHDECNLGPSSIARMFGCRKRAVQHGVEKIQRQQRNYPSISRQLQNIKNNLLILNSD